MADGLTGPHHHLRLSCSSRSGRPPPGWRRAASRRATSCRCGRRTCRNGRSCSSRVVKLGAIVHTSNPVSTPEELAFQLNDGDAKILFTVGALADKAKAAIAESKKQIELITIDETPGLPSLASIAIDAGSAGGVDRSRERHRGPAVLIRHDRPAEGRDADASQHRRAAAIRSTRSKTSRCRRCSACCRSSTSTAW